MHYPNTPPAQGLYSGLNEHDACGVGFVCNMKGKKSHKIVEDALKILVNLKHRGACGCEANTGDGAGLLIQIPHRFLKRELNRQGIKLPEPGHYGVASVYLPPSPAQRQQVQIMFEQAVRSAGQFVIGWRNIPQDDKDIGPSAQLVEPDMRQFFIAAAPTSRTTTRSNASSSSSANAPKRRSRVLSFWRKRFSTLRAARAARSSIRGC